MDKGRNHPGSDGNAESKDEPSAEPSAEIAKWNARYRAGGQEELPPAHVLVEAVAGLPPGRALDLACGAGRNAIFLAERGWEVVAVDGAEEAIRIVRARAEKKGLGIDTRVIDLEREALPFADESFDLVADLHYLQRSLFDVARRLVRPGGLFVAALRTRGINPAYCVAPGELRGRFADWETVIARFGEGEIEELAARK